MITATQSWILLHTFGNAFSFLFVCYMMIIAWLFFIPIGTKVYDDNPDFNIAMICAFWTVLTLSYFVRISYSTRDRSRLQNIFNSPKKFLKLNQPQAEFLTNNLFFSDSTYSSHQISRDSLHFPHYNFHCFLNFCLLFKRISLQRFRSSSKASTIPDHAREKNFV